MHSGLCTGHRDDYVCRLRFVRHSVRLGWIIKAETWLGILERLPWWEKLIVFMSPIGAGVSAYIAQAPVWAIAIIALLVAIAVLLLLTVIGGNRARTMALRNCWTAAENLFIYHLTGHNYGMVSALVVGILAISLMVYRSPNGESPPFNFTVRAMVVYDGPGKLSLFMVAYSSMFGLATSPIFYLGACPSIRHFLL